jgi:cysteine desulfurase
MRRVYLDHAATTPMHPKVFDAMQDFFSLQFGNPSSLHSTGQVAEDAVDKARAQVGRALGAEPAEIVFTSGGTESDNTAIKGVAWALEGKKDHIITSKIEHPAVLETCRFLEKQGFRVTYLDVDKFGIVDPDHVKQAITDKTALVTVMHANNEIGTIEPIEQISEVCQSKGVYLHTDAVQSFGSLDTDVNTLGVDLLSISGHKFYGPKGVGALYIRRGTRVTPLIHGGAQENHKRASTHNVPGIVGIGIAAELATFEKRERVVHNTKLRDRLIKVFEGIEHTRLNGHPEKRLPNNCHVIVQYVEGESMLLKLDSVGIEVATGSACSSISLSPSHVILALGISQEDSHGSLRLTVGRTTREQDIEYVAEQIPVVIEQLRQMSPMWKKGHAAF